MSWDFSGALVGVYNSNLLLKFTQIILSMYISLIVIFLFDHCSTETWPQERNNDINDPSSFNPGGIRDSGLSLIIHIKAHSGNTRKCHSPRKTKYKHMNLAQNVPWPFMGKVYTTSPLCSIAIILPVIVHNWTADHDSEPSWKPTKLSCCPLYCTSSWSNDTYIGHLSYGQ